MFNLLLILTLLLTSSSCFAQQVQTTVDVLPNTNSADSTAVLNNNLRQQQNAINAIGAYFNTNGALGVPNGGTGAVTLTGILLGNGENPFTAVALTGDATQFFNGNGAFSSPATDNNTSNVVYSWGSGGFKAYGTQNSTTPPVTPFDNYQLWTVDHDSAYHTIIETRFKKIAGINTLTLYIALASRNGAGVQEAIFTLNAAAITSTTATASGAAGVIQWVNCTADVSSLTNGTVYDLLIQLQSDSIAGVLASFGGIIFAS